MRTEDGWIEDGWVGDGQIEDGRMVGRFTALFWGANHPLQLECVRPPDP